MTEAGTPSPSPDALIDTAADTALPLQPRLKALTQLRELAAQNGAEIATAERMQRLETISNDTVVGNVKCFQTLCAFVIANPANATPQIKEKLRRYDVVDIPSQETVDLLKQARALLPKKKYSAPNGQHNWHYVLFGEAAHILAEGKETQPLAEKRTRTAHRMIHSRKYER